MSKVLVIGHAPLPFENLKKFYAPGARTWHFARPLITDGHEVEIVGIRIPFVYENEWPHVVERREHGCTVHTVVPEEAERRIFIRDLVDRMEPDCIVGVGYYAAFIACTSGIDLPVWADINGCLLAEAQMKASVYDDDSYLEHFFGMEHNIIVRGDRFSTVSLRQKYELIGELAFIGRLSSLTAGYDFVADIPNAVPEWPIDHEGAGKLRERFTEEDFLVLWSGGYNTWTDIHTLYRGLEKAMEANPRIKFVSTGGSIDGHDEITYPSFVSMVEGSKHRDNYHMEGWIDRETARSYYLACDIGINIDALTYEAMFGSRNRIMDWAVAELPALSTNLCELTDELAEEDLLFTFEVGDSDSLCRGLLDLSERKDEVREVGRALREYVDAHFSADQTTRELRKWVRDPVCAPDYEGRKVHFEFEPPPKPPITPESGPLEKLSFYLKSEGLANTLKRALGYAKRKAGAGRGR